MNPAKRRALFETLREHNPTPTTELEYTTPFELLIAVLLSAQLPLQVRIDDGERLVEEDGRHV
ncbi:hypothetical protein ACQCS9_18860, partial [Ralstonia pseudosolanacearum]